MDKWESISLALVICTFLFCCMVIIVNNNPFEFSFVADDNVVDISENFAKMTQKVNDAEINKTICETKLALLDNEVCVSNTDATSNHYYQEKHDFVDDDYNCAYGYETKTFDCNIRVIDWGDSYTYMIERAYTK